MVTYEVGVIATMLQVISEHALHSMLEWASSRGQGLAPQATEAVLLIVGRERNKDISIYV